MAEQRTALFQRNLLLEQLLTELNHDLQPSEERLIQHYADKAMTYPLIFVMGPLRSGTTLFMQWLANTGLVACPTNLLSRFYQAPILGAKIQLLLTDPRFNFRDELGEFIQLAEYRSENGKTQGVLAPNEFWYFWRRFLADAHRDVWSDQELELTMNIDDMKAELIGMMDVFQRPFAAKGMLFNYNIPFFNRVFDKVVFVQIKRDPLTNVASIMDARTRQSGREENWYSFSIPEYEQLEKLSPREQAEGQVFYINQAIETGLLTVAAPRKLVVEYELFCKNPEQIFHQLMQKIGSDATLYTGPDRFQLSR